MDGSMVIVGLSSDYIHTHIYTYVCMYVLGNNRGIPRFFTLLLRLWKINRGISWDNIGDDHVP